jgi:hypothetical protein
MTMFFGSVVAYIYAMAEMENREWATVYIFLFICCAGVKIAL